MPCSIYVSVQSTDFSVDAELGALADLRTGAQASFVGLVRDTVGTLQSLTLEHYPGMTERALYDVARQAAAHWPLSGIRIVHRIGELAPGDRIVLVIACSAHRRDAFEACEFLMDYLKTRAPFWKKETTATGEHWVDAREQDIESADRWKRVLAGNPACSEVAKP